MILNPTPEVRAQFQRLQKEEAELDRGLDYLKDLAAQTPDGRRVALEANIGLLNQVSSARDRGAEGVGLYRTEFPFLLRAHASLFSAELCAQWMGEDPDKAAVLYVDGHVRVYHGHQTPLPRHYVARQKLCLRATTDYWVNAMVLYRRLNRNPYPLSSHFVP